MENLTTSLKIGASETSGGVTQLMQGDWGAIGIDAVEWSAMNAWRFHQLCKAFYSEDGSGL